MPDCPPPTSRHPDTPTIDTLVACPTPTTPGPTGAWTAADTLKNVVVMLVHPDGTREPLAIGLPGDREVDEKRLGAQVEPARVEAFEEKDFARTRPGQGLHRPRRAGQAKPLRHPVTCSTPASSRHRWITGADEHGQHVFDLVAGRDFRPTAPSRLPRCATGDACPSLRSRR
jgi:prolyl-tRNA synthetase